MSVLASKRNESKFEVIINATEIHNSLIELMRKNFGIKNLNYFFRRHSHLSSNSNDFSINRFFVTNCKKRIDDLAALMTNNLRAANSLYPTTIHECERRRDYQNSAIVCCEQLIHELQRAVEIFDVDLNVYTHYISAINREIGLIKKWRQKDNKFKSRLLG